MSKTLNELRDDALRNAHEHGFTDASIGEDIALMHSELSEALEDHRAGKEPHAMGYKETRVPDPEGAKTCEVHHYMMGDGHYTCFKSLPKPIGIPSEMADVVIRVLHFCGKHGIDIDKAVTEKMAYNAARPFKHGEDAMIRIYLAAASSEVARAERWRDAIRSTGTFVVTHDWMAQVRAAQAAGHTTDATLEIDERVVHAKNDWDAVHTANVVWLLLPSPGKFSTGCWVELGMALERQRLVLPRSTIVMSGENIHACLFTALVQHHHASDDDAFAWLSTAVREPIHGKPTRGSLLDFDGVPRSELEERIRGLAHGAHVAMFPSE